MLEICIKKKKNMPDSSCSTILTFEFWIYNSAFYLMVLKAYYVTEAEPPSKISEYKLFILIRSLLLQFPI